MELINKTAIVVEINRQHKILMQTEHTYGAQFVLGFRQACRQIIDFLDTLEVKEIDLEKEIDLFVQGWNIDEFLGLVNDEGWSVTVGDIKNVARYFFKLGLKAAQKGE